jgi:hypothetical protein
LDEGTIEFADMIFLLPKEQGANNSPSHRAVSYTQLGILLFFMGIISSASIGRSEKFSLKSACYVSQITAI